MLTRRHIRVKVMQAIYAMLQSKHSDVDAQQKFLFASIERMESLYLLLLSLLIELRKTAQKQLEIAQKKYLATETDKNPNTKFVNNYILQLLANNEHVLDALEAKKIKHWELDDEYVRLVYDAIVESEIYKDYMKTTTNSIKEDQSFFVELYKEIIAPHPKLYEYIEDHSLTWLDDLPLVNTIILKKIKKINQNSSKTIFIESLYKDQEDREFAKNLLLKTVLNDEKLSKEIEGKTPNWDKERIAEVDSILLKMAIAEFLYFPSIPVRVTINEYLEIAKEYSTPKSSIFINGVLDKLVKDYQTNQKLNKIGRGLM